MSDPLVSVIMPCYQQERYVAEALRSVMAQTYRPLEIIIADDCSTDATYSVLQKVVASADCPHRIALERNERNRGIENYNVLMAKAQGEFIVHAHGDDISAPERVARLVDRWRETSASLVSSNAVIIDGEGREGGLLFDPRNEHDVGLVNLARSGRSSAILGAALGYERAVFDLFGPLDRRRSAIRTDFVLPFRAALLKGIALERAALLRFRRHDSTVRQITRGELDEDAWEEARWAEVVMQVFYLAETFRRAHSLGLPSTRDETVFSTLLVTLSRNVRRWSTARNRLLALGRRWNWTKPTCRRAPRTRRAGRGSSCREGRTTWPLR